jgi:hypothetical protein
VTPPALSPEAARQLALHLFLHRAFYGPDPVARVDTAPLKSITGPVMGTEAALLELEILAARNDLPGFAALSRSLLARWPGLRYRLERFERGQGLLAAGRKTFGAEAQFVRPPATRPYKE